MRGEGFVQLDHVDVRELEPCHLQSFRDREYRAESHLFRLVSSRRERNVARQRFDAECLRTLRRHDYCGGRTIRGLRRIACCRRAFSVERGLERSESCEGRIGARSLIDLENNFLALWLRAVGRGEAHGHGDGLVREFASLYRSQGFLVAAQRELVRGLAGDAETLREAFGGEAHIEVGVGIVIHEPGIR